MAFDTEAERQAALSGGVQMGMIPWTLTSTVEQAEAALALGTFPRASGGGGGGGTPLRTLRRPRARTTAALVANRRAHG